MEEELWSYHPGEFADISLEEVMEECDHLLSGNRIYEGEEQTLLRRSCVFTNDVKRARRYLPSYHDVEFYTWDQSPITLDIKRRVQELRGHAFDYALFHCYPNGKANIGYHNDKEALNSSVASVSIGHPRRFLIRKIDQTRGFIAEYRLGGGDFFVMKRGMQRGYKHSIPKELKIKEPRCNWTFRTFL